MAELIFPTWFDEKTTIAQDDYILMADSEDNNKIKKAKYSNLKWEKGDPWQDWQDGQDWQDWTDWASIINWEFSGNDLVFGKDDGTSVTIENAKTTLQWPQWEEWPEWEEWPAWNWIASITSSKSWKITTVTITETNWDVDTFQISDWADWQGSWDVVWPNSSTDWHLAVFDWTTWKLIKDWWAIGTAATKNTWTSAGNVPVLDSNWKLATSTLPWVALTDTFTVSTSADLTSLSSADQWDIAIVTSENKTYVLSVAPYSTAANWKEILAPTWGSTTISVTLTTAWWSWGTQTVTATWVTSSNTVIISPAPANIQAYVNSWVYASAQWTNSLTFTASQSTPSADLTVNVVILS